MNKNLVIWILAVVSTISTTALITLWLVRPNMPGMRPGHPIDTCHTQRKPCSDRLMEKLNLSPEQKEIFQKQRIEHRSRVEPIFENIRLLRDSLFTEVGHEQPDTSKLSRFISAITSEEEKLQREAIHHMLSMKTFLDPVQVDSMLSFYSRAMMPMGKGSHGKNPHPCSNHEKPARAQ